MEAAGQGVAPRPARRGRRARADGRAQRGLRAMLAERAEPGAATNGRGDRTAAPRAARGRPAPAAAAPRRGLGWWLPPPVRRALGPELLRALTDREAVREVVTCHAGGSSALLVLTERRLLWLLDDFVLGRVRSLPLAAVERRRAPPLAALAARNGAARPRRRGGGHLRGADRRHRGAAGRRDRAGLVVAARESMRPGRAAGPPGTARSRITTDFLRPRTSCLPGRRDTPSHRDRPPARGRRGATVGRRGARGRVGDPPDCGV